MLDNQSQADGAPVLLNFGVPSIYPARVRKSLVFKTLVSAAD